MTGRQTRFFYDRHEFLGVRFREEAAIEGSRANLAAMFPLRDAHLFDGDIRIGLFPAEQIVVTDKANSEIWN